MMIQLLTTPTYNENSESRYGHKSRITYIAHKIILIYYYSFSVNLNAMEFRFQGLEGWQYL